MSKLMFATRHNIKLHKSQTDATMVHALKAQAVSFQTQARFTASSLLGHAVVVRRSRSYAPVAFVGPVQVIFSLNVTKKLRYCLVVRFNRAAAVTTSSALFPRCGFSAQHVLPAVDSFTNNTALSRRSCI